MSKKEIEKYSPMGWNSWDCYGASVDEETVKKNAEYMAENLKKHGWEYIVVDIQWSEPSAATHAYNKFTELTMDEYSRLIPAVNRFPSSAGNKGFKPLADYVHSLGLKFGIHIMRGIPRQAVHMNTPILSEDGKKYTAREVAHPDSTCSWNTDMYGLDCSHPGAKTYYQSIFKLYADWEVDFIKCDDIARKMPKCEDELKLISECLKNCGRDMIFSISPGPAKLEYAELYKQTADMWRITDDFWDEWSQLYIMFQKAADWATHTGPHSWPDADMLPIGPLRLTYNNKLNEHTHFTEDEQVTMLTLWSIFRSPLMIGGEMNGFDDFTKALVTNDGILKMHKDVRNAHQVWRRKINGTEHILWTGNACGGGNYIAIFNVGEEDSNICIDISDIELYNNVDAIELWSNEKYSSVNEIPVKLRKHEAKAFLLTSSRCSSLD